MEIFPRYLVKNNNNGPKRYVRQTLKYRTMNRMTAIWLSIHKHLVITPRGCAVWYVYDKISWRYIHDLSGFFPGVGGGETSIYIEDALMRQRK